MNLLNVHYSAVTLRTNDSPSKIRPGESFNLEVVPTAECLARIEFLEDPAVRAIGPIVAEGESASM